MSLDRLKKYAKNTMQNDPAHDYTHVMRVYKNAEWLCRGEGARPELVLCAVLLHDIVSYAKSDARSADAPVRSAEKARVILKECGYSDSDISTVSKAISEHGFSRGVTPESTEGKILQDADRLDAIGAIGIARVFSVAGSEGRPLYSADDPFCTGRQPDDLRWTVDHFYSKLLKLASGMNTKSAEAEARRRMRILVEYLENLKREI